MKSLAGGWICLAVTLAARMAVADSALVAEIEKLRDGLAPRDPARPALTLRMADVLFDETVRGERARGGASDPALAVGRRRAIALYQEALTGNGGVFSPIQGPLRVKILFQQARLQAELGQGAEAAKLWEQVLAQPALPELRREAALRLAEREESPAGSAARAATHYQTALDLCAGSDLCSYIRYRRAWLMRRESRESESLAEMKLALRDSKGQVREEALRDWIVFHGESRGDGVAALAEVDSLAQQLGRPALVQDLAEAFYSAGNRAAGTRALELVNARAPKLAHQIRLLEDYYGVRDWDRFRALMPRIPAQTAGDAEAESEKVLRRLIVQLDGERVTKPEVAADFQGAIELHLALFPKAEERERMIEGWLAAEREDARKIERLAGWVVESPDSRKLRELRAATAQKAGRHEIVAQEMGALSSLAGVESAKAREYRYLQARALYELKDNAGARPHFEALAAGVAGQKPDAWTTQSRHLLLDILAQAKDLASVAKQAAAWSGDAGLPAAERAEFARIGREAEFEAAAAAGRTPAALAEFKRLCLANELRPKSCDNAKVLAVELKRESDLIEVLRAAGTPAELAAELEAAGFFAESAALVEKTQAPTALAPRLKLALLYELDERTADRDRVLRQVVAARKARLPEAEEKLLLRTLADANLLTKASLSEPWSDDARAEIAHRLEQVGQGDARTRALVLRAARNLGPAWDRIALEELASLDGAQRTLSFHGRDSKARFERRLKAIGRLASEADRLLPFTAGATRAVALGVLSKAHAELGDEILKSPIPEGVPAESVAQIQAALAEMAAPFQEKAQGYAQLAAGLPTVGGDTVAFAQAAPVRAETGVRERALEALHRDPLDAAALAALKGHYEAQGAWRLAAYFEGRLQAASKQGSPEGSATGAQEVRKP
jgi:hypothetical protein